MPKKIKYNIKLLTSWIRIPVVFLGPDPTMTLENLPEYRFSFLIPFGMNGITYIIIR